MKARKRYIIHKDGRVKVDSVSPGNAIRSSMCKGDVLINVSSFSSKNEKHNTLREEVEREAEQMRDDPAHILESLRLSFALFFPKTGCKPLQVALEELVGPLVGKVQDMIGKFDDGIELSVNFTFPADQGQFADIKRLIIAFGESNNQDNVHFAFFMGKKRPDSKTIAHLAPDVSCEFAWHLMTSIPMDLDVLKTWTDELHIPAFSLLKSGFELLVYTTGSKDNGTPDGMPKNFQDLRDKLDEKFEFLDEKTWYVGLSNYGETEFGATHSYDEARQLLGT
jgi:hypothetical protein